VTTSLRQGMKGPDRGENDDKRVAQGVPSALGSAVPRGFRTRGGQEARCCSAAGWLGGDDGRRSRPSIASAAGTGPPEALNPAATRAAPSVSRIKGTTTPNGASANSCRQSQGPLSSKRRAPADRVDTNRMSAAVAPTASPASENRPQTRTTNSSRRSAAPTSKTRASASAVANPVDALDHPHAEAAAPATVPAQGAGPASALGMVPAMDATGNASEPTPARHQGVTRATSSPFRSRHRVSIR